MANLAGSVGRHGLNRRDDVLAVQRLINAKLPVPLAPLSEDGICGPKTITAIMEYQRLILKMSPPDGRVDPGASTFRSLTANTPGATGLAPPLPSAPTQPSIAQALNYFVGRGWSRAQAAGIVANLQRESGLRHTAVGDAGRAYGIAQWHPDRQAAFQAFAGHSITQSTLAEQLAFVHYELTTGNEQSAGNHLRGAATANQAGSIVSRYYERPADTQGEATARGHIGE